MGILAPDGVGFVRVAAPRRQVILKVEICTNQPTGPSGQEIAAPTLTGFPNLPGSCTSRRISRRGERPEAAKPSVKAGRSCYLFGCSLHPSTFSYRPATG